MSYKKGDLVLLTDGDYSDYHILAIARAKTDFDMDNLFEEYLGKKPKQKDPYKFNNDAFVKWLMTDKNVLEEKNTQESHFGQLHHDWFWKQPENKDKPRFTSISSGE